jgi:hypothetical protein
MKRFMVVLSGWPQRQHTFEEAANIVFRVDVQAGAHLGRFFRAKVQQYANRAIFRHLVSACGKGLTHLSPFAVLREAVLGALL